MNAPETNAVIHSPPVPEKEYRLTITFMVPAEKWAGLKVFNNDNPWGRPVTSGIGDVFAENDRFDDEVRRLKGEIAEISATLDAAGDTITAQAERIAELEREAFR